MPLPSWFDATDRLLIGLTLTLKLGVLIMGAMALALGVASFAGLGGGLLAPWDRWDAPHYTDIAVFGYRADDPGDLVGPDGYRQLYPGDLGLYIVFFPLFPWLTAAVNVVARDPVLAAFVVSGVASLFVGPLLRRVVALELGDEIGRWAALFLLAFPTAYFLHIGYTESLFLALTLATFWLARTDQWWLAGVAGALAALTRINGLVLVPALAVEAWLQWRADPERRWRWAWLAAGGAGLGFGIYLVVNQAVYGDPLAFTTIQRDHWHKELSPPWDGIASILRWFDAADPERVLTYGVTELTAVGLGVAATIAALLLRFRASWTTWMAGNWLLIVSTGFVLSAPRYVIVLFGLFPWIALAARPLPARAVIAGGSAALLAFFAWRFATGQWAF